MLPHIILNEMIARRYIPVTNVYDAYGSIPNNQRFFKDIENVYMAEICILRHSDSVRVKSTYDGAFE